MPDDDLHDQLVAAADDSSPCARVLRHYEDRRVAARSADFYTAMKRMPALVVRLQIKGVAPIDCRVRDGNLEFATEIYDKGTATRQEFLDKVSKAAEITILPHATSAFVDTTDGYRARIENPRGFVDTIADDLRRNDHDLAERARIECDDDVVVVEADDDEAAGWLYQWLEGSVTHYREEYVDATAEHDAARQLRDVVYSKFVHDDESGGEDNEVVTDGGVVETDTPVEDAVFDALDRHGGKNGQAQAGDVVADVLVETDHGVGSVCACLHRLHAAGEIYQPNATQIKRTDHHIGGDA
jgi:hypothetical protein